MSSSSRGHDPSMKPHQHNRSAKPENGGSRGKATKKPSESPESRDPSKKSSGTRAPNFHPVERESQNSPWVRNGVHASSKTARTYSKKFDSTKKPSSSNKPAEKHINGLPNGNLEQPMHHPYFPQFPLLNIYPPQMPQPVNGKRALPSEENKDLSKKIGEILAAAPRLTPATSKEVRPIAVVLDAPKKGTAKKTVSVPRHSVSRGSFNWSKPADQLLQECHAKKAKNLGTKGTEKTLPKLASAPVMPSTALSPNLSEQVAQLCAASQFNFANFQAAAVGNLFLAHQMLPQGMFPTSFVYGPQLTAPPLVPVVSPPVQNVLLISSPPPRETTPPPKPSKRRKKATEPTRPPEKTLAEVSPEIPPPSPKPKKPASGTSSKTGNNISQDFDQLLSSVQSKLSQEFGVFSPGPLSPTGPLNLSLSVIPTDNATTSKFTELRHEKPSQILSQKETPLKSSKDTFIRLQKIRRKVKIIDLALQEDVNDLSECLRKLFVTPEQERRKKKTADVVCKKKIVADIVVLPVVEVPVETAEEPARVLPFKKRQYKSVPSPKMPTESGAKAGASAGGEKNVGVAASGTSSRSPSSSKPASKSKDATLSSAPAINVSEKAAVTGSGISLKLPVSSRTAAKSKNVPVKASAESIGKSVESASSSESTTPDKPLKPPSLKIVLKKPKLPSDPACPSPQTPASSISSPSSASKKRKTPSPLSASSPKRRKSGSRSPLYGESPFNLMANIYSDPRFKKRDRDRDWQVCECRPPTPGHPDQVACGDNCYSRVSGIECDPGRCPCGTECSNQVIRKKMWVKDLERFPTANKGNGVKTKSAIKAGTFICEYVGEVISMETFCDRMSGEYKECPHHYCLQLDGAVVIDAYRRGNIARFINHSCVPNSQVQKWMVDGLFKMGIFALTDIAPGEEITYDYNFDSYELQQKCYCGTEKCRGMIGSKQRKQKLNGLLMKKKLPPAETLVNGDDRAFSEISEASTSSKPPPILSPSHTISVAMFSDSMTSLPSVSGLPVPFVSAPVERERCKNSEKRMVLEHKIYLLRNYRKIDEKGFHKQFHRKIPDVSWDIQMSLPIRVEAVTELKAALAAVIAQHANPRAQSPIKSTADRIHPASWFKPRPWTVSQQDVAKYSAEYQEEVVRCLCNISTEEGEMVECENCKAWQHIECVGDEAKNSSSYFCDRCRLRPVEVELRQHLPSGDNQDNLDLWLTLTVPNCQAFQVRVGDVVYLTPDRSPVDPLRSYDLNTVDILKIDKMFIESSTGQKLAFGYHFLWPHELNYEASRSFHFNELVASHGHVETIKLEAILGRLCVMDEKLYVRGKPREFPLEHCYVCDFKHDKTTGNITAMKARDKVPIQLSRFYFEHRPEKLVMKRTYRPYGVPVRKKKKKPEAAKNSLESTPPALKHKVRLQCERLEYAVEKLRSPEWLQSWSSGF